MHRTYLVLLCSHIVSFVMALVQRLQDILKTNISEDIQVKLNGKVIINYFHKFRFDTSIINITLT